MFVRDSWKGEVNFFIREFWKSFSDFISDFIVVAESFYKGFLRSFSSKCFQSLGIEPSVILYIHYGWQQENLVSRENQIWLQKSTKKSQTVVTLSEIFLGGMMLEVQSGVWV